MAELVVPAAHVQRVAEEFLEARARAIAKDCEELVTKTMRKRKYRFFGPTLTREEATHYVQNDHPFMSSWDNIQLRDSNRAYHAKALRNLAMLSSPGGLMTITHEDIAILPTLVQPTQRTE